MKKKSYISTELFNDITNIIKNSNGITTADIMIKLNLEVNKNSWPNFEKNLDLITKIYKDDESKLWYICPWIL